MKVINRGLCHYMHKILTFSIRLFALHSQICLVCTNTSLSNLKIYSADKKGSAKLSHNEKSEEKVDEYEIYKKMINIFFI